MHKAVVQRLTYNSTVSVRYLPNQFRGHGSLPPATSPYVVVQSDVQFVCISLMADGPQHARLPIPPTTTLDLPISHRFSPYKIFLQFYNQSLNFAFSGSHAFRYEHQNTNSALTRIKLTTFALEGVQSYLLDHSSDKHNKYLPSKVTERGSSRPASAL